VKVAKIVLVALSACLALTVTASAAEPATELWTEEACQSPAEKEHWWQRWWAGVHLHRNRVNVWPEPFNLPDRETVRNPFRIMADNGWKLQNTFGDHLFSAETNELTYAGEMKLHWMLTQVPPHRRQVYVLEAKDQPATAARVASVYRHMAQISPGAAACSVQTTRIAPPAGDGSYLDNLDQTYQSSMPLPRLPVMGPATGATVGSGSVPGTY
jgi:hypothetical protein